ncbi:MAG: ParB/RepB/Spo0J family partition protein [Oscillospiraceae bacterium]|jgi:ParB family chromosome partitioning protein|nr:ParB/RepB/Spo0J family partition protein [Oscillospiraceae bacterium]
MRSPKIIQIPHEKIAPGVHQPRRHFPTEELAQLAQNIRENGILQPLTVRPGQTGYELIAGERRLRAARMAGLKSVPCIVRTADEDTTARWALMENLQRRTLDFNEEAEGLRHYLLQTGESAEEAAQKLGLPLDEILDRLSVLHLPEDVRRTLASGGSTLAHARALLALPNAHLMRRVAGLCAQKKLSVTDTSRLVRRILTPPQSVPVVLFKDVQIFVSTIDRAVATMRAGGIQAQYEKQEDDQNVQFCIRIPKVPTHLVQLAMNN